jgi:hypothetical protein
LIQIASVYPNQGGDRFQLIILDKDYDAVFNSSWIETPDFMSGLSLKYVPEIVVKGDFTIKLFAGEKGSTKPATRELMRFSLNTAFVEAGAIILQKDELDGPHKDTGHTKFDRGLAVAVQFGDVE